MGLPGLLLLVEVGSMSVAGNCAAQGCGHGDSLCCRCASSLMMTRPTGGGFQDAPGSTLPSCYLSNLEIVINSEVCSFEWVTFPI